MANCRACGGRLGLDCFNEADCLEISRQQYENDYNNGELEHYISILIYTMEQKGITVPSLFSPVNPLVLKPMNLCETNPMYDDELPF